MKIRFWSFKPPYRRTGVSGTVGCHVTTAPQRYSQRTHDRGHGGVGETGDGDRATQRGTAEPRWTRKWGLGAGKVEHKSMDLNFVTDVTGT